MDFKRSQEEREITDSETGRVISRYMVLRLRVPSSGGVRTQEQAVPLEFWGDLELQSAAWELLEQDALEAIRAAGYEPIRDGDLDDGTT